MKFYCDNTQLWRRNIPSTRRGVQYPCVILEKDNWNDYGYNTSFRAAIYKNSRERLHQGTVKILHSKKANTTLDEIFENLSSNEYCSLWQSLEDYQIINGLEFGNEILSALNDVNYNEIIREQFQSLPGFNDSLLRFSDAERAFQEGFKLITTDDDISNFSFHYIETLESLTPFGTLSLKFSRKLLGMHRTIGIIGRNGAGKTTLLANLATVLSGIQKSSAKLSPRPPFSKVIAVSYSTFDDFYRPSKNERTFSYSYCGIRGDKDLLTKQEIEQLFTSSYRSIIRNGRESLWNECMEILYLKKFETYFPLNIGVIDSYKKLSSGQKIMTLSFTQIINVIDTNSLLLFDEPENHLHPNGQNTLFKCLDFVLNKFDSFSILSTHSPIFIQNIPQKNVFKIQSIDGVRTISTLPIESFGQHFSRLTEEIFGFSENNLFYVEKLLELNSKKEQLGEEFNEVFQIETAGVQYNLNNIL